MAAGGQGGELTSHKWKQASSRQIPSRRAEYYPHVPIEDKPNGGDRELLLTNEIAAIYRVNVETVRRKIREKSIVAIKFGRHWRVPRGELGRIQKAGGV